MAARITVHSWTFEQEGRGLLAASDSRRPLFGLHRRAFRILLCVQTVFAILTSSSDHSFGHLELYLSSESSS